MQWDENQPEDHVRYARNDLMGMVREDLGYDMARHVDSTVPVSYTHLRAHETVRNLV